MVGGEIERGKCSNLNFSKVVWWIITKFSPALTQFLPNIKAPGPKKMIFPQKEYTATKNWRGKLKL